MHLTTIVMAGRIPNLLLGILVTGVAQLPLLRLLTVHLMRSCGFSGNYSCLSVVTITDGRSNG